MTLGEMCWNLLFMEYEWVVSPVKLCFTFTNMYSKTETVNESGRGDGWHFQPNLTAGFQRTAASLCLIHRGESVDLSLLISYHYITWHFGNMHITSLVKKRSVAHKPIYEGSANSQWLADTDVACEEELDVN